MLHFNLLMGFLTPRVCVKMYIRQTAKAKESNEIVSTCQTNDVHSAGITF